MKKDLFAVLNIIVRDILEEAYIIKVECDTRTQFQNLKLVEGDITKIVHSENIDDTFSTVDKKYVEDRIGLGLETLVKLFKYRDMEESLGFDKGSVTSGAKVPVFNIEPSRSQVLLNLVEPTIYDYKGHDKLIDTMLAGVTVAVEPLQDMFTSAVEIELTSIVKVYDILNAYKPEKVNMFYMPCVEVREINTRFYSETGDDDKINCVSLHDIMKSFAPIYTFKETDKVEKVHLTQITLLGKTTISLKIHRDDEAVMICFSTDKKFVGMLNNISK